MSIFKPKPQTLPRAPTARIPAPPPPAKSPSPPSFVRVDVEQQRAETRPSTKRADYEGGWQRVILPSNGRTRVFSTTRRWRGCDVFLALPTFEADVAAPLIRVMVYAVVEGIDRVLVASGIYRHNPPNPALPITPSSWLAGARVAADRFDVELSLNGTPLNPGIDAVDVGVIASDEVIEVPKHLGAVPLNEGAWILRGVAAKAPTPVPGDPGYELVAVQGTQAAGATPRWLHVLNMDSTNPVTLLGNAPIFSFGMPAIASSVYADSDALRTFRFSTGLTVAGSTTGADTTCAAIGEVAYQAWFR